MKITPALMAVMATAAVGVAATACSSGSSGSTSSSTAGQATLTIGAASSLTEAFTTIGKDFMTANPGGVPRAMLHNLLHNLALSVIYVPLAVKIKQQWQSKHKKHWAALEKVHYVVV